MHEPMDEGKISLFTCFMCPEIWPKQWNEHDFSYVLVTRRVKWTIMIKFPHKILSVSILPIKNMQVYNSSKHSRLLVKFKTSSNTFKCSMTNPHQYTKFLPVSVNKISWAGMLIKAIMNFLFGLNFNFFSLRKNQMKPCFWISIQNVLSDYSSPHQYPNRKFCCQFSWFEWEVEIT